MHYITSYVVVGVKYELKTPVCLCEALSRISFLQSVSAFLLRDFSPLFPVYLHTITVTSDDPVLTPHYDHVFSVFMQHQSLMNPECLS